MLGLARLRTLALSALLAAGPAAAALPQRELPSPALAATDAAAPLDLAATITSLTRAERIEIVVRYAWAQRGDDYRWGAAGPYAYDCSGLVMMSYRQIGVYLPHYSGAMLAYGRPVSRAYLARGDVIWPFWGHVQLYLGGGYVIQASSSRDAVVVSRLGTVWRARRMI